MLWSDGLRDRRPSEGRILFAFSEPVQHRRMSVCPEHAAEEFTDDGGGARPGEDEFRQRRRLVDLSADDDTAESPDRDAEFLWQNDRPLALVVHRCRRSLAGHDLDVVDHRFAIATLSDVNTCLPFDTDRSVVQEMAEKPRERERAQALIRSGHREVERCGAKTPAIFVVKRNVDRRFRTHYEAVHAEIELVGAYPAAVSAEQLVTGSAGQRPAILQGDRDALA